MCTHTLVFFLFANVKGDFFHIRNGILHSYTDFTQSKQKFFCSFIPHPSLFTFIHQALNGLT